MPEPRELLRFTVVGLAAYGVTLLGDYRLKLTVCREKPVTTLFFATAFAYLLPRRWSFAGRGAHHRLREAALFVVVNAGGGGEPGAAAGRGTRWGWPCPT